MESLYSAFWYLLSSKSAITSFISSAKYRPLIWLSVLRKISLNLLSPKRWKTLIHFYSKVAKSLCPLHGKLKGILPIGLYLVLNLSKRWKVFLSWKKVDTFLSIKITVSKLVSLQVLLYSKQQEKARMFTSKLPKPILVVTYIIWVIRFPLCLSTQNFFQ